ncbi:MAG TPA: helix-turn-helix domain-containing protein [Gemmatimonadales bacterium]|jgi:AraC-like DNA-binding protein
MLLSQSAAVATIVLPHTQARLDAAIGSGCKTYHVRSVSEAIRCVRERPVRAVLVSPHAVPSEQLPELAKLVRSFPNVSTLAVMASREDLSAPQTLLDLGAHGVRGVIDLRDRDGWHRLRAVVSSPTSAAGARILQHLVPALGPQATVECRRLFEYLVRVAPGVKTVRELSRLLGSPPSTFMSRFLRARLPSPKQYLVGIRLAYAAELLEAPGRSIADAAYALEFSSPQSFGRHVRSTLGVCATEFRRHYGFARVVREFGEALIFPYRSTFGSFRPFTLGAGDPGQPG